MRCRILMFVALIALAINVDRLGAQVCPPLPAGFSGLNGSGFPTPDNQAILNIFTSLDSSDALSADNVAEASLGEAISINFRGERVPPGSPLTIAVSTGLRAFPTNTPLIDGSIWLDVPNPANIVRLVDGLALLGAPTPFAATPGPTSDFALFANTGLNPALIGQCFTVQAIVLDPASPAPFFLSVSNPVAFGIAPAITGLFPSVAAAGSSVTLTAPGQNPAGGHAVLFEATNTTVFTGAGGTMTVPGGQFSSHLGLNINGFQSLTTPDAIENFLVVRAPTVTNGPATLSLVADPLLPVANSFRASGQGTLSSANALDVWPISLLAGDIIEVEVYSLDATRTRLLDGFGTSTDPFAVEGFDPGVQIEHTTNVDNLVFDQGTAGTPPYLLHFDDNSGPGGHSFLRWQAKYNDVFNLVVSADPATFVTGTYLINVIVTRGIPCVNGFRTGSNRTNIVASNGTLTLVGANIVVGRQYTVEFIPAAGAGFASRMAFNVLCSVTNRLTLAVPAFQSGQLPLGLHFVRLTDQTTGLQGEIWDNTVVRQFTGVLPDLVCIRGATRTTVTTATLSSGVQVISNVNNQSLQYGPTAAGAGIQGNGFFEFNVPANANGVYIEALGVNDNVIDLFDTDNGFATSNGIFNPSIRVFPPPLVPSGPFNDDDGFDPVALFDFPMGIGANAALIDFDLVALYPGGGPYLGFLDPELIFFGNPATHVCLINAVWF